MRCLGSPRRSVYWPVTLLAVFLFSNSAMGESSLVASAVNFGSVQVGSSLIRPIVLTNNGRASVTIYKVTVSGTGFSFVGPQLPVSLPVGQSAAFSVSFYCIRCVGEANIRTGITFRCLHPIGLAWSG